jgi:hypothetical protein
MASHCVSFTKYARKTPCVFFKISFLPYATGTKLYLRTAVLLGTTVMSQQHIFPLLDLFFLQMVCSGVEELHRGNSGDFPRRPAGDHRLPYRWGPTTSTLRASYHTLCTTKEPSMHSNVAGSAAERQMRAACVPEV